MLSSSRVPATVFIYVATLKHKEMLIVWLKFHIQPVEFYKHMAVDYCLGVLAAWNSFGFLGWYLGYVFGLLEAWTEK